MNFGNIIEHHADRFGDRTAFTYADERVTYAGLLDRVQRTAAVLRAEGIGKGDVVGMLLHNSLQLTDVMLACAYLGAIWMPVNWRLAAAELQYVVEHSGAKLIVSEEELLAQTSLLDPALPRLQAGPGAADPWRSLDDLVAAAEPVPAAEPVDLDDVARIMYTSGTTSRPKGVMLTHGNVAAKCAGHCVEMGLTQDDRGLICGPLYHVGALDLTLTNMLYLGGSTHIMRRFDAVGVLREIQERGITTVWLAPAMVNMVLAEPTLGDYDTTSMRVIIDGGEKMPLVLIQRLLDAFPSAWFADAYGLTESVGGDTFLDKGRSIDKLGSVGKAVIGVEVQIVDLDDAPVPAGEVGEVCLRGAKIFKGYWHDDEATATAKRGGWFHTGDLGYLDEDGCLFIVDRLKDIIITGGENVASLEVERVLYEHPAVLEAAVVGSPHPRWLEVPVAYLVLRPGVSATDEELEAFCRQRLASYKTPKGFRILDELPRNPSGKVLKRTLRDREHVEEG
ncbi:long-chain fatty acid--CoA ligase [Baekduia soli]|uniref:Long-chain fatty acid--CoA ligase n=1 Tax=Baekduia soli TaxID=496014 RepID=A0A5B8U1V4_9ACTN|nr:long-chain fatty acid--CoA ligase [Baekduia soli]QEC46930.1 long-chain fatty acid--CoA ligase [Baekduia soli]